MRIAVLTHELDDFDDSGYVLREVTAVWTSRGHEVRVLRGATHPPEAFDVDVGVLHVDLTRIPAEYLQAAARFPRTLNLGVQDISKRVVSTNLVTRGDGYAGPVIVKTNRNCAGLKEALLARASGPVRRVTRAVHRRLPWMCRSELGGKGYRIFDTPDAVPWMVWHNPALVVERFLPERRDGFYWLRAWEFLGDHEMLTLRWGAGPIVAVPHVLGRQFVPPDVPAEIRARRRELGFDFGKFDYVESEQGPVLLDANRTPTNRTLVGAAMATLITTLANGLEGWAARPASAPAMAVTSATR